MAQNNYILYSSNYRPKYVTDILNVLALPLHLEYQFRYNEEYITTAFKHQFSNDLSKLIKCKVLIAYKDNSVVIPVRWAVITDVEKVTDFYIIKFSVKNYAKHSFTENESFETIQNKTFEYKNKVKSSEWNLALQEGFCDLVKPDVIYNENDWILTAKALAKTETFKNCYFLTVLPLLKKSKQSVDYCTDTHHYRTNEYRYYNFKIAYFSSEFISDNSLLEIEANSDNLKLTTSSKISLDSRYDSFKTWLKCKEIEENSYNELIVSTKGNGPQVNIKIPIFISKSKKFIFLRIFASFLGAILVSLPGLLGSQINLYWKIGFASLGALIIAISANIKKPI